MTPEEMQQVYEMIERKYQKIAEQYDLGLIVEPLDFQKWNNPHSVDILWENNLRENIRLSSWDSDWTCCDFELLIVSIWFSIDDDMKPPKEKDLDRLINEHQTYRYSAQLEP